ncbi:hypothetical protein JRZ81_18435 [Acinetobacter nosocomialis]|nr:hypothetical protein [Acinetobacter nosocomialis]MBM9552857.1 hypothetical protein [Acinetobacter nosocomialis]
MGTGNAVVTVDTTAPSAPVLDPINATNPVTGTAELSLVNAVVTATVGATASTTPVPGTDGLPAGSVAVAVTV